MALHDLGFASLFPTSFSKLFLEESIVNRKIFWSLLDFYFAG